jgi:hypothetical protein
MRYELGLNLGWFLYFIFPTIMIFDFISLHGGTFSSLAISL